MLVLHAKDLSLRLLILSNISFWVKVLNTIWYKIKTIDQNGLNS